MTVKTFWVIFLKVLGVWMAIEGVGAAFQSFVGLYYMSMEPSETSSSFLISIFVLAVYIGLPVLLIFNSDLIIETLKLEKSVPEEKIDLTANSSSIISVAIIIIGGFIFVDSLSYFLKELYEFFKFTFLHAQPITFEWLFFYFIKCLIGYFLITNSKMIVTFIEKRKPKKQDDIV